MKNMKKIYKYFAISLVVATSCSLQETPEDRLVTIKVTFPERMDSKVSLSEKKDDTGLELSWDESDVLVVTGESSETFTITEIDGNRATFTGKRVKGSQFDIVLTSRNRQDGWSYIAQEQSGTAATDHLEYEACLKGIDTYRDVNFTQEWAQEHGGELLQSGVLLLYFQLPEQLSAASNVNQVKLESSSALFYATDDESNTKVSSLTMNIIDGNVGKEKTVRAYLMTPMREIRIEDGTGLRLTVATDKGTYFKDIALGETSIVPGKRNVIKLNSKNWSPLFEHKNFTFMTYNVGAFGKYKEQLGHESYPEAAAILKNYRVDIVGLNEVEYTKFIIDLNNQPKKFANEMGSGWNYYTAIGGDNTDGNAIVSSPELKIIKTACVDIPCEVEPTHDTRSLGVVECEDFVFCVTHLDHNSNKCRAPQVKMINDWILENYGSSDKPIILTGDMNAKPGKTGVADVNGFADYWKALSVTDGAVTYPTRPSDGTEQKCIDYVLIWKNDNVEYYVTKTAVANTCPGVDVTLVSDHYPVYVEMTFVKKYEVEGVKSYAQSGVDRLPDALLFEEDF